MYMTLNRKAFFDAIRPTYRRKTLSQEQVNGLNRLLDVWSKFYAVDGNAEELAYDLATSKWETNQSMQPIVENLNYSVSGLLSTFSRSRISVKQANTYGRKPGRKADQAKIANIIYGGEWGRKHLGNTEPNDGWIFRGMGDVMSTGRANARKSSKMLNDAFGFNVDFEANPDLRADPIMSAHCLFMGNRNGLWTGRKISDFIDGIDETDDEDFAEYVKARYVVNLTDKAREIAKMAIDFEHALAAGGYGVGPGKRVIETVKVPVPTPDFEREMEVDITASNIEEKAAKVEKPGYKSRTNWASGFLTALTSFLAAVSGLDPTVIVAIIVAALIVGVFIIVDRQKKTGIARGIINDIRGLTK